MAIVVSGVGCCGIIILMNSFEKYLKENVAQAISILVLVVALAVGGYAIGYKKGASGPITTLTSTGERVDADYDVYWEAWKRLRENHVDADKKTDKDLMYGSMAGLAQSFDDPHTTFFPPAEGKRFQEDVKGSFGGIGAEVGERDGVIGIVAPLKGSAAERAGLQAGDLILKIGTVKTDGLTVTKAVGFIRGEIGTKVVLNVFRKEKWLQPRDITITREEVKLPTLDTAYFDGGKIAQVQLYAFNQNAPFQFYQEATKMLAKGTKGMILDMRNNPGGYLEVATHLAGWFLDRGQLIVSEHFKDGPDQPFVASGNGALKHLPVVILINGGSASASEILAGTLRDQRNATIVGETSYGKGTVQEILDLKDGSSLKITIAHWVMPKGQILNKDGLVPDYIVIPTDEEIKAKKDVQLEKALEVLRAQINGTALPPVIATPTKK